MSLSEASAPLRFWRLCSCTHICLPVCVCILNTVNTGRETHNTAAVPLAPRLVLAMLQPVQTRVTSLRGRTTSSPASICVCACVTNSVLNRRHIMSTTMSPCIRTTGPASVEETPKAWLHATDQSGRRTRSALLLSLCWHTRHALAPNPLWKKCAFCRRVALGAAINANKVKANRYRG